jgi:hypothetical protein
MSTNNARSDIFAARTYLITGRPLVVPRHHFMCMTPWSSKVFLNYSGNVYQASSKLQPSLHCKFWSSSNFIICNGSSQSNIHRSPGMDVVRPVVQAIPHYSIPAVITYESIRQQQIVLCKTTSLRASSFLYSKNLI